METSLRVWVFIQKPGTNVFKTAFLFFVYTSAVGVGLEKHFQGHVVNSVLLSRIRV